MCEGTKWTVSRNDCYTIDRVTLKPDCRVWYHFLKNLLIPSNHNSTILKESVASSLDYNGMKDKYWEHYLSRGEEPTVEKKTTEQEGEVEKTKSKKKDDDVAQTHALANTTTTPRATTPITAQECVVHQLIDELTKSDSGSEDEMPISQHKRKRFKTTGVKEVTA
ncbi:hypothetical protein J1N35_025292 [Gossypium stocksii]|uniref:Uncharacterized protein n=1 Tax=Gossypium stocksii TaxID=47602 RepID=A0A9D3ZXN6_9ROSI|nr:hypothetical protein J1N35_025292 [Gossypium stocksii]